VLLLFNKGGNMKTDEARDKYNGNMRFHEYADLFPMMTDQEFMDLTESMRREGYHSNSPIIVYQDKILDGRNRYRAAETIGVLPMFTQFVGSDEAAFQFAKSNNLTRKHWTPDQLSVIALDIEALEADRAKERMLAGVKVDPSANQHQGNKGKAAEKAAKAVGVSTRKVQRAKALKKSAPSLVEEVKSGKKTLKQAEKEASNIRKFEQHAALVQLAETVPASDRWEVFAGDIGNVRLEPGSIDAIITDPPYPKDYLPLWGELARFAKYHLKPGGVLLAMTGNLYIPDILQMLGEHLTYQWQMACTLPGQHSEVHAAWVNNQMWKPILVYRNGGDLVNIGSDLFQNNGRDKDFHEWGQGVGGYVWQIEHFTKPNDLICDPFLGGGTTAIAALPLKRRFVGFDIDPEKVAISKGRIGGLDDG
jgi:hypothetical protein